jgi:hypothetical protein
MAPRLEKIPEGSDEGRDTRSPSKSSRHSISIVEASSDVSSLLTEDAKKQQLLNVYAGRALSKEHLDVPPLSRAPSSSSSFHSSELSSLTESGKSPSRVSDLSSGPTSGSDKSARPEELQFPDIHANPVGETPRFKFPENPGGLPSQDRGDSAPSREDLSRLQGEIVQEYTRLRNVLSQPGRDLTDEHRRVAGARLQAALDNLRAISSEAPEQDK